MDSSRLSGTRLRRALVVAGCAGILACGARLWAADGNDTKTAAPKASAPPQAGGSPAKAPPAAVQPASKPAGPAAPGKAGPQGGLQKVTHRTDAGTLDPSGWCEANSTEGGFSVLLPNLYNDFTIIAKSEDGAQVKSHILSTKDKKSVIFSAAALKRSDDKIAGDPLVALAAKFEKRGVLKSKKKITLGSMKGVALSVGSRNSAAEMRIYRGPHAVYQLIVEAPASVKLWQIEADAKKFMDSLKVE